MQGGMEYLIVLCLVLATVQVDNTTTTDRKMAGVEDLSSRAEGILSNFDYRQMTPEGLLATSKELIKEMENLYDDIGNVTKEEASFANVIKPMIDNDGESTKKISALSFAASVALEKNLRDASTKAKKEITKVLIDLSLRKDIFENVKAFADTEEANNLDYETKRYVDTLLRSGKRNGLQLSGEKLDKLKNIKNQISELGTDFRKCISEDTSYFHVEEKDLEGLPQDLIDSFDEDESGRLKLTCKYPHYYPVMDNCKNPHTRYLMLKTFRSRCLKENTPRLEQLIALRQKQANLLGYPNHAAFVQETKMAQNPETVENFLSDLRSKLKVLWVEEEKVLLNLKKVEFEKLGLEYNGKLEAEDFRYYTNQVEENNYSVDHQKLKEYFPLETVTKGMMKIYQDLLGLNFTKLEDPEVWQEDVSLYQVDDQLTGDTLGYFYLDLHPRDGKFAHAAVFGLQLGNLDKLGVRQKAVRAMVCNFPRPTAERPALLKHKQVKTFFHEFGHVMHGICSRANISTFSGTRVEGDFTEAPSQMLENWVWEEESLRMMSGHYKDGSPIPKDLLKNLLVSRTANIGGKTMRQIYFGTFDQLLHTRGEADTQQIANSLYRELMGIEQIEGTNMAASFGHLVGYDGRYYGYLWSEVFSQDMFSSRFGVEGILNTKTGKDYRDMILAPGGSQDAEVMLKNFLGREPNQEAFLKSKGLEL